MSAAEIEAPSVEALDLPDHLLEPDALPRTARREPLIVPQRVRTSRVVIRRVDPWSVLRLSFLFWLTVCLVLLVAGAILWAGAAAAGLIDNIESFIADVGWTDFKFLPGEILRALTVAGFLLVLAGTAAMTLLALLFNQVSDVVGGLRVTLAEDVAARVDSGSKI